MTRRAPFRINKLKSVKPFILNCFRISFDSMQVFTLGYQGLGLEQYVRTLGESGIGVVLDVREKAWSYNRKYIGSVMERALSEAGIRYLHLKDCGNPSINRKTAASPEECLSRYRSYLQENKSCLELLMDQISIADSLGKPACLTCFEHDPIDCHRSILLELAIELQPALKICHLIVTADVPFRTVGRRPVSDTIALQL